MVHYYYLFWRLTGIVSHWYPTDCACQHKTYSGGSLRFVCLLPKFRTAGLQAVLDFSLLLFSLHYRPAGGENSLEVTLLHIATTDSRQARTSVAAVCAPVFSCVSLSLSSSLSACSVRERLACHVSFTTTFEHLSLYIIQCGLPLACTLDCAHDITCLVRPAWRVDGLVEHFTFVLLHMTTFFYGDDAAAAADNISPTISYNIILLCDDDDE